MVILSQALGRVCLWRGDTNVLAMCQEVLSSSKPLLTRMQGVL